MRGMGCAASSPPSRRRKGVRYAVASPVLAAQGAISRSPRRTSDKARYDGEMCGGECRSVLSPAWPLLRAIPSTPPDRAAARTQNGPSYCSRRRCDVRMGNGSSSFS